MNILLVYTTVKFESKIDIQAIVSSLECAEHTLSLLKMTQASLPEINNMAEKADLLLCYGTSAFVTICKKNAFHKPLVYIVPQSELMHDYASIWKKANCILVIKNTDTKEVFYPREIAALIEINPVYEIEQLKDKATGFSVLFVETDEVASLNSTLSLIRLSNHISTLPDTKVSVLKRGKLSKALFNKNITLLTTDNDVFIAKQLSEKIAGSNVIIGNGFVAFNAILAGKPTIILGNKGYGGIVPEQLLNVHYQNNFQGRIGGEINEPIPFTIALEDIKLIRETDKDQGPDFGWINRKEKLQSLHKKSMDNILSTLEAVLQKATQDYAINNYQKYKVSSKIIITPITDNIFKILDTATEKTIYQIGILEARILEFLSIPHTLTELYTHFAETGEEILKDFIDVLLENKLVFTA